MLAVAINGATGRMGKALMRAIRENEQVHLCAALTHHGSPHLGQDAGRFARGASLGVPLTGDLSALHRDLDVLIDFSLPVGTMAALERCVALKRNMVIGTTALTEKQQERIRQASAQIAIVLSPNMSIGIHLSLQLLAMAARVLGEEVDVEICETHHRHKVDAPSGTALHMGEVIADSLGWKLADHMVVDRGAQQGARGHRSIGFASLRGGDIVGEHRVLFATVGEHLEIRHQATSRMSFARGALRAAQWVAQKDSGLFSMQQVLDLPD